jgi:hypothetical protein
MSYLQLEFEDGFFATPYITDPNLYIISAKLNRQYTNLYGAIDLEIALPFQNFTARNQILSRIFDSAKIKVYQYSDALYSKDKKLLLSGYATNYDITTSNAHITITDATELLERSQIKVGYNFNSRNFIACLKNILEAHGFLNLTDGIIYPTAKNLIIPNDVDLSPGDNETILNYLHRLANSVKIYITTIYLNNKSYLYCLDTAEVLKAKYKPIDLNLDVRSGASLINQYEIYVDNTKIRDTIALHTKADVTNQEAGSVATFSRNALSLDTYTEKAITSGTTPPILYNQQIKNDINKYDLREYAKYMFKKQIQSAIKLTIKLPGLYPDLKNPSQEWNIGTPVNIVKSPYNIIYNDLSHKFKNVLDETFGNDFIVAGFSMDFTESPCTIIEIVPNSFIAS